MNSAPTASRGAPNDAPRDPNVDESSARMRAEPRGEAPTASVAAQQVQGQGAKLGGRRIWVSFATRGLRGQDPYTGAVSSHRAFR